LHRSLARLRAESCKSEAYPAAISTAPCVTQLCNNASNLHGPGVQELEQKVQIEKRRIRKTVDATHRSNASGETMKHYIHNWVCINCTMSSWPRLQNHWCQNFARRPTRNMHKASPWLFFGKPFTKAADQRLSSRTILCALKKSGTETQPRCAHLTAPGSTIPSYDSAQ
jgi:hypothetical protein